MKTNLIYRIFLAIVLAVCLCGCQSAPQLYSWGSYETQVYAYLKGEGAQIEILERELQEIESGDNAVPPGFYAHMGLLYVESGDDEKAIASFQAEKDRFPEAAPFMDFLLGRYGKE